MITFVKAILKWSVQVSQAVCASPKFSVAKESGRHCLYMSSWTRDNYTLTPPTHTHTISTFITMVTMFHFWSSDIFKEQRERWWWSDQVSAGRWSSDFILVAVSFWHLFTSPVVYGGVGCCSKSSTIAIFASGVCNAFFQAQFSSRKGDKGLKKHFTLSEFINKQKFLTGAYIAVVQVSSSDSVPRRISGAKLYLYVQIILFFYFPFVTVRFKSKV